MSKASETEVTLEILRAVSNDESLSQRSAARQIGIALGLVNTYLKRCVKKGFIKIQHAPNNRYSYYLTPKGLAEKSRLTAEFLSQSLNLFRQAHSDYAALLQECEKNGWSKIALMGVSDLAEIISLYAGDYPVEILGIVEPGYCKTLFRHLPVVDEISMLSGEPDAFMITDLQHPQKIFDTLCRSESMERILAPELFDLQSGAGLKGSGKR